MKGIIVRTETGDDIKAIDVVNISAFEGEAEAKLISELRTLSGYNPELSLVAEFNGRIVGHLMLSPVVLKSSAGETRMLALAPMSVVPSQSHRGIGSELVEAAVAKASAMGYGAIIVAGHPDFYSRFGFGPAQANNVRCNLPVPEDVVLVREIVAGTLGDGGVVHYPPPFLSIY